MKKLHMIAIFVVLIFSSAVLAAADKKDVMPPKKVSKADKCPVCGMFVFKYPDWVGQIIFQDGQTVFFDGAKDLFKYYFSLKKYNPEKSRKDINAIYVSEYYDVKYIDGFSAYYVIGSTVYGPMGRELIPLETEKDAKQFMKDHNGKKIIRFEDITPKLLKQLDY